MIALVMVLGAAAPVTGTLTELVQAGADTCAALPFNVLFEMLPVPELDVIEFTRDRNTSYSLAKANKMLRDHLPKNLVIYIPGWMNTPTDESSETIVNSLLTKNPLILLLDTRPVFGVGYVGSASRVYGVAKSLFKFIRDLYRSGYSLSSIHLLGYSLGSHVAGIAGKLVQKRLKGKIRRITGLDPAKPCFPQSSEFTLSKEDAKFVYVIHSSVGVLGIKEPLGHVDVYFNGLKMPQPECKDELVSIECDHALSWRVFSASIDDQEMLIGRQCRNFDELSSGRCGGDKTLLGYDCSSKIRGIFLYKTDTRHQKQSLSKPFQIPWLGG